MICWRMKARILSGVIGIEVASFYAALGAKVSILEIADHILPPMPKEIAQRASMNLKKKGVEVSEKISINEITGTPGTMKVKYIGKKGEELEVEGEAVLMATGRKPVLEGLFDEGLIEVIDPAETQGKTVEEMGVAMVGSGKIGILRGAILGDKIGRTGIPGIYVIGDAKAGNIQLAHVASAQAINLADFLGEEDPLIDMDYIPSCIYTIPEIATVGISEEEAKEREIPVRTGKVTTGSNGKCLIEGTESGFVKLVAAEDGTLLGAQMVCPRATDMIGELTLAVSKGMKARELATVVHPHPTFSEMIMAAAEEV